MTLHVDDECERERARRTLEEAVAKLEQALRLQREREETQTHG